MNTATGPGAEGARSSFPSDTTCRPFRAGSLAQDDSAPGRSHFFTVVDAAWRDEGRALVLVMRSDDGLVSRHEVRREHLPLWATPETLLGRRCSDV